VTPQIIPKSIHGIDLESFDQDAIKVLQKLKEAGHSAYLVGGCVRDLLLKKQPKDFDISTSAKPEEIKRLFKNCILIGKRFRLAHLRFGRNKILEVSTFRSGDTENEALITRDNLWGSEEEDVLRRDFTINGLFYDCQTETIIDYVDGYVDLQSHCLKTIGQPYVRFKQDPVRMIRCLKFQARFDLSVDDETKQALVECRKEIVKSSQARILEELLKMLESGSAKSFFLLMSKFGLLEMLLPSVAHCLEHKNGAEIYNLLEQVDLYVKEGGYERLSRSFVLCSIIYTILDHHIMTHIYTKETPFHLGVVQTECHFIIEQIFKPFFHLPKKMKAKMTSILTLQYKLTPLDKKPLKKPRIPKAPEFSLALDFLRFRSNIDPELFAIWKLWNSTFELAPKPRETKKRSAVRKRRRPKTNHDTPPSEHQ
jgi:poly(A) polymerase